MKILHTSDLHVGKKLMGRERYGEYEMFFEELAHICRDEKIELVLVAGDVFDTFTPSAEAERIFYSGIKKVAAYSTVYSRQRFACFAKKRARGGLSLRIRKRLCYFRQQSGGEDIYKYPTLSERGEI